MINPSVIIRSFGETSVVFKSHFIGAIIIVPLSYYLIKNYGMMGGAISMLFRTIIVVGVQLISVKALLLLNIINLLPLKQLSQILGISIICIIIPYTIINAKFNDIITIIFSSSTYFLFISILFFVTKIFDIKKLKYLLISSRI